MKKKVLSFLLALVMVLSLVPTLAPVEAHADDCQHQWDEHEVCTLCGAASDSHIHELWYYTSDVEDAGGHMPVCRWCYSRYGEWEAHSYDEHYICTVCGYADRTRHECEAGDYSQVCDDSGNVIGHAFSCKYCYQTMGETQAHSYDEHYICTVCGYVDRARHECEAGDGYSEVYDDNGNSVGHAASCMYCNWPVGETQAHQWDEHNVCTVCHMWGPDHVHEFSGSYCSDGTGQYNGHWKMCKYCNGFCGDLEPHTFDEHGICTLCGKVGPEHQHVWNGSYSPVWDEDRNVGHAQFCAYCYGTMGETQAHSYDEHYICTACGYVDSDRHECEAGDYSQVCDDSGNVIGHAFSCKYCYQPMGETQAHSYDEHYICTVCRYVDYTQHKCVASRGYLTCYDENGNSTGHQSQCRDCFRPVGEVKPHSYDEHYICTACWYVDYTRHKCVAGNNYSTYYNGTHLTDGHVDHCLYCHEAVGQVEPHTYVDDYCAKCGDTNPEHTHVAEEMRYYSNAEGHCRVCWICSGEMAEVYEPHTYNADGICMACGYGKAGHKHEASDRVYDRGDGKGHCKVCRYCSETIEETEEPHNFVHGRCTICGDSPVDHSHVYKYIIYKNQHVRYCLLCYAGAAQYGYHTLNDKGICTECGAMSIGREKQIQAVTISCDSAKRLLLTLTMDDGENISAVVQEFDGESYEPGIYENGICAGKWYSGVIRTDKMMLSAVWMVYDDGRFCVKTQWGVTSNVLNSCEYYDVYTAAVSEYGMLNPELSYAGGVWTVTGQACDGQRMRMTVKNGKTEVSYPSQVKPAAPVVKPSYVGASGKPYLYWSAVEDAIKYEIYISYSEDGVYQFLGSTTKLNYTDTSADTGETFYYKVKAVSADGVSSDYSDPVTITCRCARPVVKPSYVGASGKPYIYWSAVDGAGKYYVYRSTSKNGTYEYIGYTTKTNYTDSKAVAGTTYYYKVKGISSVKSTANSALSASVTITCRCARPSVKITLTQKGDPKLTWSAVTGASQYEVYRATSKNGSYTKMFTTSNLSYTNTSAKAGTTYYYKVKAVSKVKSTANSAFSTVVSIRAR